MKISVVTACFNSVETISETIESVLSQRYSNLEFIVIDGGSTDGTQKVIEGYSDRLALLICEPDGGQYHGIQKGFDLASGEVVCWLNSDDILLPGALSTVYEIFSMDRSVRWITGRTAFLSGDGQLVSISGKPASYVSWLIAKGLYNSKMLGYLQQENIFWRRDLMVEVGGLNLNYKFAADFELWMRFARKTSLNLVNRPLAAFRLRPGQQRSSLFAKEYEDEVIEALAGPVKKFYKFLPKNRILSALLRSLIYWRSPLYAFSRSHARWIKVYSWRSLSRATLSDLFINYTIEKKISSFITDKK